MTLIEAQKSENNYQKDKILVVGGYKCVYLLSVKHQNLLDKITIPGNNYVKCLVNSGIEYISIDLFMRDYLINIIMILFILILKCN